MEQLAGEGGPPQIMGTRGQQPEQCRDTAAGGEQPDARRRLRPAQIALGHAQLDQIAHRQVVEQMIGEAAARLTANAQLDGAATFDPGQAVAATVAHPVDRQVQLHMLAWAPATRIAIAAQAQRQQVVTDPAAPRHPGEDPIQAPGRVQPGQHGVDFRLAQPASRNQYAHRPQQRCQPADDGKRQKRHAAHSSEQVFTKCQKPSISVNKRSLIVIRRR